MLTSAFQCSCCPSMNHWSSVSPSYTSGSKKERDDCEDKMATGENERQVTPQELGCL